MDTAPVRFVTQKDNIFDDMPSDDETGGKGSSNGSSNGNGKGHGSDTGPTGPFTALSSAELAAVTIEDDEDVEDLSAEVEPAEDSVRARVPVAPTPAPMTMAATPVPSLDQAAEALDWGLEEAATRAATGSEQPVPGHTPTAYGMPAPPLADAFTVEPGTFAPLADEKELAFAPTVGIPSMPPAAPPVVSPFVLVADVESQPQVAPAVPPPPPASPFPPATPAPPAPPTYAAAPTRSAPPALPVQPWGTPVAASSGAIVPFQSAPELPIIEDPMPATRAMPEVAAPAPFTPAAAPVDDDFQLSPPRKSSAGTILGILAGIVIAGVIGAGVWWFQLREKTGTLVLRTAEDAVVTVDGAPSTGVSGLFIVRDLGVGTHSVVVVRPNAAPWINAVQISAGDSLQIEAPGARGGDTGPTTVAANPAIPPVPGAPVAVPGSPTTTPSVEPGAPAEPGTPPEPATPASPAQTTTPTTPHQPATPRTTTPGTTTTPRTTTTEPAARGGTGFLSVNTIPWSAVEVDGHSVGNTPVLRHELRSGDHRVTLIVQAWNIRQTRRVVVRPGETATVTVRFQEPGTQTAPQQGPGPMGPRPMGPGPGVAPMGPRPMGPGPMGPGPMGPGPMGPRPMGPGPAPMGPPPRN